MTAIAPTLDGPGDPAAGATTVRAVLELVDVVKSYGSGATEVRALTDVSLAVGAGEFVAVRGPSGCGKSSLLHLAGALEDPTAGRVAVGGRDLATLDAAGRATLRRRDVGFVFQRLNLVPGLTAVENVMLPLELDGIRARTARPLAIDALGAVGLHQQLDRYPDDFSGGQQRIAIARATVGTRRRRYQGCRHDFPLVCGGSSPPCSSAYRSWPASSPPRRALSPSASGRAPLDHGRRLTDRWRGGLTPATPRLRRRSPRRPRTGG